LLSAILTIRTCNFIPTTSGSAPQALQFSADISFLGKRLSS